MNVLKALMDVLINALTLSVVITVHVILGIHWMLTFMAVLV